MKRTTTAYVGVGAALALTVSLAGCAGSASGDKESSGAETPPAAGGNEVTFLSWSPIEQTTAQMIDAFKTTHPDAEVSATIYGNTSDLDIDLQTRAGSNSLPDLIGLTPGAMTQKYKNNLMPLQDCAVTLWGEDWQDQFYPIGLEQARLGNEEGDENFYQLPMLIQSLNMWANSDLFAEAGLEPPATWDELKTTVADMSGGDFAPLLMPAKDGWVRNAVFVQIANNISPGVVEAAEKGEVSWSDPALVEAFQYWGDLFSENIVQPGAMGLDSYPNGVNQFEAGNGAMIPLGAWWIQQSDPTKDQESIPPLSKGMAGFEPFLFPTIPGGAAEHQIVGGTDVGLGISKNSANPELACQVLGDFISGDAAQVMINTLNDLPAYKGLEPAEFTSDKQKEVWDQLVEWMPDVKWSRNFAAPAIDQAVQDATAGVATGELTPEQAAELVQAAQDKL